MTLLLRWLVAAISIVVVGTTLTPSLRAQGTADAFADANVLSTVVPLTGTLHTGETDYFVFEVDASLAEQVFDLVVETDVDVVVALYDADRALLQERRGAGGALRSLYLEEGAYGFSIRGDPGAYRLSFRLGGSPQAGVEQEPNDTVASAQALDETLNMRGHLTLADVDTFSFVVPEGGATYRVQVLGRGDGLERVSLLDGGGASVATTTAAGGRARIDDLALAAGTYLVRIEGRDAEYALRLLDLGAVVEPPPVLEARTDGDEAPALAVRTVEEPAATAPEPAAPVAPEVEAAALGDPCATPPAEGDGGTTVTLAYRDGARLDCGSHLNTLVEGDLVALDPEAAAFRFIWVAASVRGTVIKIDTDTGEVVGEYWTAPAYDPERPSQSPSRTVVDRNGNVWVGNRDDDVEGRGSVVQIGLLENGQCVDRNGDGVIDTSTGIGDVRGWSNAGDVDRLGGVATAEDECVLQYVRVTSRGVRHVSVDLDGNVWVSGTSNRHLDLIDGATGAILRTEPAPCGGYGGLVDRAGVLWSARPLLRWDPSEPLTREACLSGNTYGIGLDYADRVWISDFGAGVCRYRADGEVDACFEAGEGVGNSRGVAVTRDDHVWVVHTGGDAVTRFAPDGTVVARIGVGGGPTGVSIDARGKPWVISGVAQRIDPATNEIDLTVNLDAAVRPGSEELPYYGRAGPYVYSDMTGQLVFGPPDSGTFTLRVRGPSFRTSWGTIRYDTEVPDGASVEVRVSTSDGLAAAGGLKRVHSGDALDYEGQYLYVEVSLQRGSDGTSPTFGALEIDAVPVPLAPGAIRVEARPDLVASSNAIEVILDASGSMGQVLPSGESRWVAARSALVALAETAFPSGVPLALRVYGHLEPTTCHMALELELEPFEAEGFRQAVAGIAPKLLSQTPLADAILAAGEDLAGVEGQRMVVLVTDGEESCGGDPEAAIRSLRERGIATVNIIGFALQDPAVKEQFARWAELGGGRYLDTATGEELGAALGQVLLPEFVVLDPEGAEVARGRVNSAAVEVPSGVYRVQVLSTPGRIVEGVQVVEREVGLTVALRE
jgi:streptogramin lyase